MEESNRLLLLSAAAPWLAAALAVSLCAVLVMIGSDAGAKAERSRIGEECRSAGAFTVRRTGFTCEVRR